MTAVPLPAVVIVLQHSFNGDVQIPRGGEEAAGEGAIVLHMHACEAQQATSDRIVHPCDDLLSDVIVIVCRRFSLRHNEQLQGALHACILLSIRRDQCSSAPTFFRDSIARRVCMVADSALYVNLCDTSDL